MRRSITAFLSLCLLASAPTAALAKRATPATESHADMLARRSEQARAVVEKHFKALAAGNAKAVRTQWTRDARVTSVDGDGRSKQETLSKAMTRWLTHTDGLQWTIQNVTPLRAGQLEVTVQVIWNGTTFDDTLRLVTQGSSMRIRHKSSRPHGLATSEIRSSGY